MDFNLSMFSIFRFFLALAPVLLGNCIGPTTPLGAVHGKKALTGSIPPVERSSMNIDFTPEFQCFHSKFDLTIKIFDPLLDTEALHTNLSVSYNGADVTKSVIFQSFLSNLFGDTREEKEKDVISLQIKSLTLDPLNDHEITVEYTNSIGAYSFARLPLPACHCKYTDEEIRIAPPFSPPAFQLDLINHFGALYDYNPIMLAALIAQESSFKTFEVSSAKALGLTQITPLAAREIERLKPGWPRLNIYERAPAGEIEELIQQKEITPKNDWRLDPEKNIEGGTIYLDYLTRLWQKERFRELLQKNGINNDSPRENLQILLASYNSGYRRVANGILEKREHYLDFPELKEAKKYVRKVFSYCQYFQDQNGGANH